jgi:predicted Na+-dependent transporter
MGVQRALMLVASQKTLSMALPVLAALRAPAAAALPCVLVHLLQTLLDSLLAARWLRSDAALL